MANLYLTVKGQTLTAKSDIDRIVENSVNYLQIKIDTSQDPEWDGLTVKCIISNGKKNAAFYHNSFITETYLKAPGFVVNLVGFSDEGVLVKVPTNPLVVHVYPSGILDADDEPEQEIQDLSWAEQVVESFESTIKELSQNTENELFSKQEKFEQELSEQQQNFEEEIERNLDRELEEIVDVLNEKQSLLISGENIKTINEHEILGEGDLFLDSLLPTLGNVKKLEKEDFTNGYIDNSTFLESDYWIINQPIKVEAGDIIVILPSENSRIIWRLLKTDIMSEIEPLSPDMSILYDSSEGDKKIIVNKNGYLSIQFAKLNGIYNEEITNEDYNASIIIDQSRISKAEHLLTKLQEEKQELLVDGKNVKTINGESILSSGDINLEEVKNKSLQITNESTDKDYPSAKATFTLVSETHSSINNAVANAIQETKTGKNILRLDNVSPVEHDIKLRVFNKNLLNIASVFVQEETESKPWISSVTSNSLTISLPEGYSGNGYCLSEVTLKDLCPGIQAGKQYFLSGKTTSLRKWFYLYDTSKKCSFGEVQTFTSEDLLSKVVFYGRDVAGGDSIGDCVISELQMEEGITATAYEEYVDLSSLHLYKYGKNLITKNDVNVESEKAWGANKIEDIEIVPGTYTLSFKFHQQGEDKSVVGLAIKDTQNLSKTIKTISSSEEEGEITSSFVIEEEGPFKISIYAYSNITNTDLSTKCSFEEILFEAGEEKTSFEKFLSKEEYEIDSLGELTVKSLSPTNTFLVKNSNIKINYNADISKYVQEEINKKIIDNNSSLQEDDFKLFSKYKPYTQIVEDCQDASKWTIENSSGLIVTEDTRVGNFIFGKQSLHSDKLMSCTAHTYDLTNNYLIVKIRINSIDTGAHLFARLSDTNHVGLRYELARSANWTVPEDWQEIIIPINAYAYDTEKPDFSQINHIEIFAERSDGSAGGVDWNLQYVGTRPKTTNKGIVTFAFDDGWSSQYTGVKLLAEKGITSTMFTIKEAVESNNYLTLDNLKSLVKLYGTDIEVHGHPAYTNPIWTEDKLREHWSESQKFIRENDLGEGKHMAYPNGIFPENVVELAKDYFNSCRIITSFMPIETLPVADRYRIRAVSGVGSNNPSANVEKIKGYLDRIAKDGGWLILVLHKIGDTTGDSMYCSETDLNAIADYAIDSGVDIMNYAEVMERFYADLSPEKDTTVSGGNVEIPENVETTDNKVSTIEDNMAEEKYPTVSAVRDYINQYEHIIPITEDTFLYNLDDGIYHVDGSTGATISFDNADANGLQDGLLLVSFVEDYNTYNWIAIGRDSFWNEGIWTGYTQPSGEEWTATYSISEKENNKVSIINDDTINYAYYPSTKAVTEYVKEQLQNINGGSSGGTDTELREAVKASVGETTYDKVITNSDNVKVGSYSNTGSYNSSRTQGKCTEKIDVSVGETYRVSGACNNFFTLLALYDTEGNFIKRVPEDTTQSVVYRTVEYTVEEGVSFIAFSTADTSKGEFIVTKEVTEFNNIPKLIDELEAKHNEDILKTEQKIDDDIIALDEKITLTVKNICPNSNFVDTSVWELGNTATTMTVENNVATLTNDGSSAQTRIRIPLSGIPQDHIVYVQASIKSSPNAKWESFNFYTDASFGFMLENPRLKNSLGLFNDYYGTFDFSQTSTSSVKMWITSTYNTVANAKDQVTQIKNVFICDLTESFGAGKEPSASEFYNILKAGGSWFKDSKQIFMVDLIKPTLPIVSDYLITVGENGDCQTINEAIERASKVYPAYKKRGIKIEIRILDGTIIDEQILVESLDLSYISITTDNPDNKVVVTPTANNWDKNTVSHDSRGNMPFFAGEFGARLPMIKCLFSCTAPTLQIEDKTIGIVGYYCNRGSMGLVVVGSAYPENVVGSGTPDIEAEVGFEGFYDCIIANNNSEITLRECIARNAGRYGVMSRHISRISARSADLTGCQLASAYADRSSIMDVRFANVSDSLNGIQSYNTSNITAVETIANNVANLVAESREGSIINCDKMTIDNVKDVFKVVNGGTIVATNTVPTNVSGTTHSKTVNTLDVNGVIYA